LKYRLESGVRPLPLGYTTTAANSSAPLRTKP
jgi:hypothetical protein